MNTNNLGVSSLQRSTDKRQQFDLLMPSTFAIETSLVCNLKCPECALGGNIIDRKKGLMLFDQFKVIASRISPFAKLVYLHLWGEPMLNPDIFSMIRLAATFSSTHISTNALTLNRDTAEGLITSGVSEILVSIDGFTQEVYEIYRVGGDLQKALDALRILQELNVAKGNKVKLIPQFIVFKHNQHEMNRFRGYCREIGLEAVFKAPYLRKQGSHISCADDPQYIRPHYPTIDAMKLAMADCPNPKDVFTILLDGSVVACCHDYKRATCFGNIFDNDVLEIWKSPEFRQFRWDILSGNAPSFCVNDCMSYFLDNNGGGRSHWVPTQPVHIEPQQGTLSEDHHPTSKKQELSMERLHRLDPNDPAENDFFQNVITHPHAHGLSGLELDGKGEQQKRELILGEYFAEVAKRAGKIASELLFQGQWAHETPEWFDHRHHMMNPERWFTDFWTASADNVIPLLQLGGKLLNMCSGDGFYDYYFYRKRASEILCVEMNEEAYRIAKRLHSAPNIQYVKDNILTWTPPMANFDVVAIRGAIEHFAPVEQQKIFKSAHQALKPGGWFCGDTPAKKTDGKHLSWHEYEWADEDEMRDALNKRFDVVQTGTLESKEIKTLFWRCQK